MYTGGADTPMLRGTVAVTPAEIRLDERIKAMVPTANLALPGEIADAVLWLTNHPRQLRYWGGYHCGCCRRYLACKPSRYRRVGMTLLEFWGSKFLRVLPFFGYSIL
jgi:hypothetical protein